MASQLLASHAPADASPQTRLCSEEYPPGRTAAEGLESGDRPCASPTAGACSGGPAPCSNGRAASDTPAASAHISRLSRPAEGGGWGELE